LIGSASGEIEKGTSEPASVKKLSTIWSPEQGAQQKRTGQHRTRRLVSQVANHSGVQTRLDEASFKIICNTSKQSLCVCA